MALTIHTLDFGDIELETSFLVLGHECGRTRRVPVYGFLITGGEWPILVDTGYRDNAIMESLEQRLGQIEKKPRRVTKRQQLADSKLQTGH